MFARFTFLMALFMLTISACDDLHDYCSGLRELGEDEEVQIWLRKQIDTYVVNREITADDILSGGGMVPGTYWLLADLDWGRLNFENAGQMRLIGDSLSNIDAVFFGERSRQGLMVKMPNSQTFGLAEDSISLINDDIAMICIERD